MTASEPELLPPTETDKTQRVRGTKARHRQPEPVAATAAPPDPRDANADAPGSALAVREDTTPLPATDARAATPLQVLLALLQDPNTDPERIAQMMTLQERWEKNEARKAYDEAFTAFKAEPPTIVKDKHVKFETSKGVTEYHHAELDQVADKISVALSRHGLSHRWETQQRDNGIIRVTCHLKHVRGHVESVWLESGRDDSGGKNNIQALASTVSYLERYTLLAITGLATKGQDDDGRKSQGVGDGPADDPAAGDGPISAEQKKTIITLLRESGSDTVLFLNYMGCPTVDEIPARKFQAAIKALEEKKKKAQQKGGSK